MPTRPTLDAQIERTAVDRVQIKRLCGDAYKIYDQADYKAALRAFYQAWLILPKPQNDHLESGWVLAGIGDCYFKLEQYQQALEALRSALHCPEADKSAFIHLRLGQCMLHTEETEGARTSLFKAYQVGGQVVFEDESSQYLLAIGDLIAPSLD